MTETQLKARLKTVSGAAQKFIRAADVVSGAHLRVQRAPTGGPGCMEEWDRASANLAEAELRYQHARKHLLNMIEAE